MILPSKHLPQDRALLTVGARILSFLTRPMTVSAIWEELNFPAETLTLSNHKRISYEWYLLALDLLYALDVIDLKSGLVVRRAS